MGRTTDLERGIQRRTLSEAHAEGGTSPDARVYMALTQPALREYLRRRKWRYGHDTLERRIADEFYSYLTRDRKSLTLSRPLPPSVQDFIRTMKIGGRKADRDRFCFISQALPQGGEFVLMLRMHPPLPPSGPRPPAGKRQVQSIPVRPVRPRPEDYVRSYDEAHHQWVWTRKDA